MAIHVAIDGYDSLEQIGVGGMAAVYKARKVSIDKTVAIKVLFPYLATDESFTERFQREAKAAASIQHDNIVNVIDFGESEGAFYIVMEYYDGRTLEAMMKERPGIPLEISVQILLEVAYGLEAAHRLDIVHRDIKPANIIYTRQGSIKIADFGLAKKSDSASMITQLGKVIGTPAYMSPEQAAGRPVSAASDIFSLGVVAFELLSRRKPFEGASYSDVLEKIQTLETPNIADLNPFVEPPLEHVIERMLEKDERDRYPDATALLADLEAALEKTKIARDRGRLASYIRDPAAYENRANEKLITACVSRGAFFMQKGAGHLEDAVREFRRILFLDPSNERARKNLERLSPNSLAPRPGNAQRTVTLNATGSFRRRRRRGARRDAASRRVPRWAYAASVAAVALVVAGVLWTGQRGWTGLPMVREQRPTVPSALADDAALGAAANGPAATPSRTAAGAADSSHAAPAGVVPSTAARDTARTGAPDSATPSGADVAPRRETTPTVKETVVAETPRRKTPVQEPARKPARKPAAAAPRASGTLSVFFLGGVGEIRVNGKTFPRQPPFEGVSLPAGTYRVSCRMSGDETPKEVTITIAPDRETVIEYELGGVPVVTGP